MIVSFDYSSKADYDLFIRCKSIPLARFTGRTAYIPDEYAHLIGKRANKRTGSEYKPIDGLFDYQEGIARISAKKKKFAVFAQCGLGKDLMMKEAVRHAAENTPADKKVLIMEPLNCIEQSLQETERWYGNRFKVERVKSGNLND